MVSFVDASLVADMVATEIRSVKCHRLDEICARMLHRPGIRGCACGPCDPCRNVGDAASLPLWTSRSMGNHQRRCALNSANTPRACVMLRWSPSKTMEQARTTIRPMIAPVDTRMYHELCNSTSKPVVRRSRVAHWASVSRFVLSIFSTAGSVGKSL